MKKFIHTILGLIICLTVFADDVRTCSSYTKSIQNGVGGVIVGEIIGEDTCSWHITAIPNEGYTFAHWTNMYGSIIVDNPIDIYINRKNANYALHALFVKTDAKISEWFIDSCYVKSGVYRISDDNNGWTNIYIENNKVSEEDIQPDSIDAGIWKLETTMLLDSNKYAGNKIHIIFYNECSKPTAVIDTIIPVIITHDTLASQVISFPENADIQIMNGATFTIDRNIDINSTLDIYAGGSVIVLPNDTLKVKAIIMRGNGIDRKWAQLVANGSIKNMNNDTIYYDYTLDYAEYYPLALPYNVKCSDVYNPINGNDAIYQTYYYDSEIRSTGRPAWRAFDDAKSGAEFIAGQGYSIYAVPMSWNGKRQQKAVVRFPMVAHLQNGEYEKMIHIYSNNNGEEINKNWNLIGNPYLANFYVNTTPDTTKIIHGHYVWNDELQKYELETDGNELRYITYSNDGFRTYYQDKLKGFEMKSFNSYFTQTLEGNELTFLLTDRRQAAPMRRNNSIISELETGIVLTQGNHSDHIGFLYGNYTNDYELNADLVKEFGNNSKLSLYSLNNNIMHSFLALPYESIGAIIPIGFKNGSTESMMFSFDNKRYINDQIEAIWLTDIEENTYTNLLNEDYTFTPNASQSNGRFYISIIKKQNDNILTDINNIKYNNSIQIYDILGRKINQFNLAPVGVYIIDNDNCRKEVIKK